MIDCNPSTSPGGELKRGRFQSILHDMDGVRVQEPPDPMTPGDGFDAEGDSVESMFKNMMS